MDIASLLGSIMGLLLITGIISRIGNYLLSMYSVLPKEKLILISFIVTIFICVLIGSHSFGFFTALIKYGSTALAWYIYDIYNFKKNTFYNHYPSEDNEINTILQEEVETTNNTEKNKTDINNSSTKLNGIGGWLILIVATLIIFPIIHLNYVIYDILPQFNPEQWFHITDPEGMFYHPLLSSIIIFELVYYLIIVIMQLILLVLMFMKKKIFRTLMLVYLFSHLILGITLSVVMHNILTSIPFFYEEMYLELQDELITSILQIVISSAIWIPYFLISKRVRNTFIE